MTTAVSPRPLSLCNAAGPLVAPLVGCLDPTTAIVPVPSSSSGQLVPVSGEPLSHGESYALWELYYRAGLTGQVVFDQTKLRADVVEQLVERRLVHGSVDEFGSSWQLCLNADRLVQVPAYIMADPVPAHRVLDTG